MTPMSRFMTHHTHSCTHCANRIECDQPAHECATDRSLDRICFACDHIRWCCDCAEMEAMPDVPWCPECYPEGEPV